MLVVILASVHLREMAMPPSQLLPTHQLLLAERRAPPLWRLTA